MRNGKIIYWAILNNCTFYKNVISSSYFIFHLFYEFQQYDIKITTHTYFIYVYIYIYIYIYTYNVPVPYPTMHHFVTEVYISVLKWCIFGHMSRALWDSWHGSVGRLFETFVPLFGGGGGGGWGVYFFQILDCLNYLGDYAKGGCVVWLMSYNFL